MHYVRDTALLHAPLSDEFVAVILSPQHPETISYHTDQQRLSTVVRVAR